MEKRIVVPLALVLIAIAGVALFVSPEGEAETSFTNRSLAELTAFATSDQPVNLRLMALAALRKKTGSGVEAGLAKVATGSDAEIAVYATTQLGKKKTSAAKSSLKSLVTDSDKLSDDLTAENSRRAKAWNAQAVAMALRNGAVVARSFAEDYGGRVLKLPGIVERAVEWAKKVRKWAKESE